MMSTKRGSFENSTSNVRINNGIFEIYSRNNDIVCNISTFSMDTIITVDIIMGLGLKEE